MDNEARTDEYSGPAHKVDRYLALAMRHLALDPDEDDFQDADDSLTDEMDRLWLAMDPSEIVEVKHIVSSAVFHLAGKPEGLPAQLPVDFEDSIEEDEDSTNA